MFKAIELKQTERALDRFAQKVVKRAKHNLAKRKDGRKGPANTKEKTLSDSLKYFLQVFPSGAVELLFTNKGHFDNVEYGRRAGAKQPPPSVLQRWIKIKPLKLRGAKGQFIKKNDKNIKGAAFVIGRSIAKKGIKPRYFWRDAFAMHWKRLPGDVIKAYANDAAKFMRQTMNKK